MLAGYAHKVAQRTQPACIRIGSGKLEWSAGILPGVADFVPPVSVDRNIGESYQPDFLRFLAIIVRLRRQSGIVNDCAAYWCAVSIENSSRNYCAGILQPRLQSLGSTRPRHSS